MTFTNNTIGVRRVQPGMWLIRPRNVAYNDTKFKLPEVLRVAEMVADTPKGSRPFRVYIDPADDGAEEALRVGERTRETFNQRVGLTDLLSVTSH